MSQREMLWVGPPFARRRVVDLTREELIDELYKGYEQQEKYLEMLRRRGESMRETMAACARLVR